MLPEVLTYWGLSSGFGTPKAQDVDPGVAPSKAIAGTGDDTFDDSRRYYEQAFNEANAWGPSATATNANAATIARNDLAARKFQDANVARLQSIAAGGPGGTAVPAAYANLAAAQKTNNAVTAARATPNNMAGAARLAGNTNQALVSQNQAKIAALGAQEQLAAYNALNPALAGMRAQDWAVADEQAKMRQQAALANAGAQQTVGLSNQEAYNRQMGMRRGALSGVLANDQSATNARMAERRSLMGLEDWDRNLMMERQKRQDMQQAAILDTTTKTWAHMSDAGSKPNTQTASDRNVKKNVRSADDALKEMYDHAFGGE